MNIAIITGGSRGLGLALTRDLTEHGWTVITDGRDGEALAGAGFGPSVVIVPGDITDPAHRADLVAHAAQRGGLGLLVNNAGTLGPAGRPRLAGLDPDAFLDTLAINTVAPLALVQAALPLLRQSQGAVVNITSDASVEAYEGWGGYGASKAALDHLTRVLAEEEGRVRFWALDPGDMRTQMHQDAFAGEDISDRPLPEAIAPSLRALLASGLASGRVRSADLVSEAVAP